MHFDCSTFHSFKNIKQSPNSFTSTFLALVYTIEQALVLSCNRTRSCIRSRLKARPSCSPRPVDMARPRHSSSLKISRHFWAPTVQRPLPNGALCEYFRCTNAIFLFRPRSYCITTYQERLVLFSPSSPPQLAPRPTQLAPGPF